MLLVDLNETGLQSVTELEIPTFQRLMTLRGDMETLETQLPLIASETPAGHTVWMEITVATDDYLPDLPARIQSMTEGLPVEVLRIRRDRGQAVAQLFDGSGATLDVALRNSGLGDGNFRTLGGFDLFENVGHGPVQQRKRCFVEGARCLSPSSSS